MTTVPTRAGQRDVAFTLGSTICTCIIKMTVIAHGGLVGAGSNQGYLLPGDAVTSFMRGRVPIIPSTRDHGQANNVSHDKVRSCSSHRLLAPRTGSAVQLIPSSGNTFSSSWTSTPSGAICPGPSRTSGGRTLTTLQAVSTCHLGGRSHLFPTRGFRAWQKAGALLRLSATLLLINHQRLLIKVISQPRIELLITAGTNQKVQRCVPVRRGGC